MTRLTPSQAKNLVKRSNQNLRVILNQGGKAGSYGEEELARQLQAFKINFEREYHFNPNTKHRADFYLPEFNLLVEVEGGTRGKSRHTTHEGYSADLMKYNAAQILGYSRLAYTTQQVKKGEAIVNIQLFIRRYKERNG